MSNSPSLRELMSGVSDQMRADFEKKTRQIPHMGERGAGREDVVKSFLRDYLPQRLGVESGFVMDAHGGVSKQIDVIIYDKPSAPVFKITESQRLFPIECVAGVISVKSTLNQETLVDIVDNCNSVVALDRAGSNRDYVMYGGVMLHATSPLNTSEPVFTAGFCFDSIPIKTAGARLTELNKGLTPNQKVQVILGLSKGLLTMAEIGGETYGPTYAANTEVVYFDSSDSALALFYTLLFNEVMRKVPLGVRMTSYMRFPGQAIAR